MYTRYTRVPGTCSTCNVIQGKASHNFLKKPTPTNIKKYIVKQKKKRNKNVCTSKMQNNI